MTESRRSRKILTNRRGGFSLPPYDSFNLGDHVGDDPSAVERNRQRLADSLGIDRTRFVYMEQLHTNTVTVIDEPQSEPVPATDAIVTTTPDLALVVLVADCVPVLLSDDYAGVAAAVHAGRTGARNGIVRKSVEKMIELGATPENIHALLGAAASGYNYEVPESMADDVDKHLPGAKTRTKQGTAGVDVRAGLLRQLYGLGVRHVNVEPNCTIDNEQYFSYRREGKTGRQAGIVILPERG
ncbi:peptidoglycan editing factor PgeF [Corynebacterium amycolatum]|uniref:peptidoglycan editing factor PgeF n=1 Tax=Corynebacterium amycolatum TaxID=43765 RepID=UPI002119D5C6|nr:peptidoglycan editing factor PgeF [Corynebacterium amycolatum]MCQ9127733.1 peptidoglycan editing factor PgeF [Corynebacterium amycolatum]MCQ9141075.1 peptidoglycan editing factor PgeF [Corynebacterium amycolatum]